jgi:hypothetical protein
VARSDAADPATKSPSRLRRTGTRGSASRSRRPLNRSPSHPPLPDHEGVTRLSGLARVWWPSPGSRRRTPWGQATSLGVRVRPGRQLGDGPRACAGRGARRGPRARRTRARKSQKHPIASHASAIDSVTLAVRAARCSATSGANALARAAASRTRARESSTARILQPQRGESSWLPAGRRLSERTATAGVAGSPRRAEAPTRATRGGGQRSSSRRQRRTIGRTRGGWVPRRGRFAGHLNSVAESLRVQGRRVTGAFSGAQRPLERRKPCDCRASKSTATGIRTPVSAVRGRRPSPLDDSGRRPSVRPV